MNLQPNPNQRLNIANMKTYLTLTFVQSVEPH